MLEGKVAVVTGGSRGIGRAISERLASMGATVYINFVSRPDAAEETRQAIVSQGGKAEIIQCDASKESYRSPYNIFWLMFRQDPQITRSSLLLSVAEYRIKYPSTSTLPEVRQRIAAIVKAATRAVNR